MNINYYRLSDIILSLIGLVFLLPLFILIGLLGYVDTGSPIFRQERLGLNKTIFTLYKFRTMRIDALSLPSHLADASKITKFGRILRRYKLDELPQLWNILKGEMSFVGPRPCLLSQSELITEREKNNIFLYYPGVTGLAQVRNIDMSNPQLLVEVEKMMLLNFSFKSYMYFILVTLIGRGSGDAVKM
jgi:O-antigen biosynthesis protein WbqP